MSGLVVEGAGFEPAKPVRAPDLQSGGFNHSPTPPCSRYFFSNVFQRPVERAPEGTRTPNLPITNRLRCQLRHRGAIFNGDYGANSSTPQPKNGPDKSGAIRFSSVGLTGYGTPAKLSIAAATACVPIQMPKTPVTPARAPSFPRKRESSVARPDTTPHENQPLRHPRKSHAAPAREPTLPPVEVNAEAPDLRQPIGHKRTQKTLGLA